MRIFARFLLERFAFSIELCEGVTNTQRACQCKHAEKKEGERGSRTKNGWTPEVVPSLPEEGIPFPTEIVERDERTDLRHVVVVVDHRSRREFGEERGDEEEEEKKSSTRLDLIECVWLRLS